MGAKQLACVPYRLDDQRFDMDREDDQAVTAGAEPGYPVGGHLLAGASAAQTAGVPVTYVGTVPHLFTGHGRCDSSTPWLHDVSFDAVPPQVDPGSLHPTQDGQRYGYEAALAGQ
jgi:hypothetical protein